MQETLAQNEAIKFKADLHWIIFVVPFLYSFAILGFIFYQKVMPILNIPATLLIMYFCGGAWIKFITTSYTLTNERIISKTGLLFVQTIDMSVNRIESVVLNQSLLGRIFDYGDLDVRGTGGDNLLLNTVENASVLRKQIFAEMKDTSNA